MRTDFYKYFPDHRIPRSMLGLMLVAILLLIGGCSGDSETVKPTPSATVLPSATAEDPFQELVDIIAEVQEVERNAVPLTFNVDLTMTGPQPEHLFVPSNRNVQIVFRNRARSEVHYRVVGLSLDEIAWIAVPEEDVVREDDVSDEDHDAHHDRDFVPWRAESASGIQPSGDEIHGYTTLGELDVVRFVATRLGTFDVVDPLHPEFFARLTVY